jgi:hypothetical protein
MTTHQTGKKLITTVHQTRLPLCLPIIKANKQKAGVRISKTSWGSIKIEGAYTQRHQDILSAIMVSCTRKAVVASSMHIMFDPGAVLRILDTDTGKAWLKKAIKEMIKIDSESEIDGTLRGQKVKWISDSGLVKDLTVAKTLAPRRPGTRGGDANMWIVVLSKGLTKIFEEDMGILMHEKTVSKICRLTTGEGKALARFLLTHETVHSIDWATATEAIGIAMPQGPGDKNGLRRIREAARAIRMDQEALSRLGITLDERGARYQRIDAVTFQKPETTRRDANTRGENMKSTVSDANTPGADPNTPGENANTPGALRVLRKLRTSQGTGFGPAPG